MGVSNTQGVPSNKVEAKDLNTAVARYRDVTCIVFREDSLF